VQLSNKTTSTGLPRKPWRASTGDSTILPFRCSICAPVAKERLNAGLGSELANHTEAAAIQRQMEALEQASALKNRGIQFRQAAAPQWCSGEQRGPDRGVPQDIAAGRQPSVSAVDHSLRLKARGAIRLELGGAGLDVKPSCSCGSYRRTADNASVFNDLSSGDPPKADGLITGGKFGYGKEIGRAVAAPKRSSWPGAHPRISEHARPS
jgi:hypothetical protein